MTESPCPHSPFAALKLAPHRDWPAERQRAFLHALLRTGDVPVAAASVGASLLAVACLRRSLGRHSTFSLAWRCAVEQTEIDAAATRLLRRGLDAAQLARVDTSCYGTEKARLAFALALHALRMQEVRRGV